MIKLPKSFEKEILNKHNIYWGKWNNYEGYISDTNELTSESYNVNDYEIIGIAIKAIYNIDNTLKIQDNPVPYQFDNPAPKTQLFTCTTQFIYGNGIIDVIFKAIEKIWK